MQIQIDSREKARAIKKILAEFDKQNIVYCSSKLYVGDYMSFDNPRLIIDRKQNVSEIYRNLCHEKIRIDNELDKAKKFGIKLIILCEHGGKIRSLEDIKEWNNPQLNKNPYAWNGVKLYKEMRIKSEKYDVDFMFCDKNQTGKRIIELLGGG